MECVLGIAVVMLMFAIVERRQEADRARSGSPDRARGPIGRSS